MARLGLVVPDDLWNEPLSQAIGYIQAAEAAGFHSVWKGEASGSNGLMMLGAAAMVTDQISLGTAVANVYSRTPSLLGMSAVTLDALSSGRAILGLGVSSPPVIEEWHGLAFNRPLRRLRESIEIIKQVCDGGTVDYDGEIFDIGPYSVGLPSDRIDIPVFNAAMGEQNRRLTGEFADGWMPVFIPRSELSKHIEELQRTAAAAGRDPVTVAPWIPLGVADDRQRARRLVRELIAQEMAMGYDRLLNQYGYGAVASTARTKWLAGDRAGAAEAIPVEVLDEFAVYGTPADCRESIHQYCELGVDLPIVWPPFSATADEYRLLIESLPE